MTGPATNPAHNAPAISGVATVLCVLGSRTLIHKDEEMIRHTAAAHALGPLPENRRMTSIRTDTTTGTAIAPVNATTLPATRSKFTPPYAPASADRRESSPALADSHQS